uniref:Uncharacterized protein n=1 Tax=Rhizophora mucronata TaxID=61149 RepID=A0A2P2IMV9_RHIMU
MDTSGNYPWLFPK